MLYLTASGLDGHLRLRDARQNHQLGKIGPVFRTLALRPLSALIGGFNIYPDRGLRVSARWLRRRSWSGWVALSFLGVGILLLGTILMSRSDDETTGDASVESTLVSQSSSPSYQDAGLPKNVQVAADQLLAELRVDGNDLRGTWAQGALADAARLADSVAGEGSVGLQTAWVVEVTSSNSIDCRGCFGVVPSLGRVHGLVVLDRTTSQIVGGYVRDEPADLSVVGRVHELS